MDRHLRRGPWRAVLAAPTTAATPAAPAAALALGMIALDTLDLDRLRCRRTEQRAIGQPPERHAETGGHVADRVEGAIVGDDLDHVSGPRARQPHTRRHGDAQVTPVAHADGRCAVHERRAVTREQAGRVVTDDAPVADGEELRAPAGAVDREMREHPRDVLRAARVLDVEEDGPPARGRRRRRRDPRGKRGLGKAER